jgi:hypothetical protein
VPRSTDLRVRQLCKEILAATTKAEVERILPELRAALEEHIRLAKDSLGLQAKAIAFLDELASKDSPKPDPEMAAD